MKLEKANEDLGQGVSLEMVLIPAGKFMMGSPASEKGRSDNETQHEVTLTKPFYMGKYEVTQEQWEAVIMGNIHKWKTRMGDTYNTFEGSTIPVTNVSWEDCQEFIRKLNYKTNGGYRLPTEAEWEYACRAGTTTAYYFGDEITPQDANYRDLNIQGPVVESYKPNAFGLYDMHGNVYEWCEDWKADYPAGAVTDPKGPGTGTHRVLRGGWFSSGDSFVRSSARYASTPTFHNGYRGLRLARTMNIEGLSESEINEFLLKVMREQKAKTKREEEAKAKKEAEVKVKKEAEEAKAKEAQKKAAMILNKEVEENADLGKAINLEMILVPRGKFMMGSPASEKGRDGDEKLHEVTLTMPYYIGKYEVTQEQYEAVMGNNPSFTTKGAKLPVTNVSWEDCQEFIKKLNAKTDGGYRLPTEAEWEYACRAGTTTSYSSGDKITPKEANYSKREPMAVGSYKPNAFGLYDMHGNVCEWCEGWYGDYPEGAVMDPKGPATGSSRVVRGGSFVFNASKARSSERLFYNSPTARFSFVGFRLARTP